MKIVERVSREVYCIDEPVIHDERVWYIEGEDHPEYPRICGDYRTSDLFLIAPFGRHGDYSDADASFDNILALLEDIDDSITDTISYDDLKDPASHQKLMDIAEQHGFFVSPVYALIHGVFKFSLSPFNDQWDSGQCGWMYATPAAVKSVGGWKEMERVAWAEIDELNMYINGEVYNICSSRIECIVDGCVYTDPDVEYEAVGIYGLDNARAELKELTNE